MILFTWIGATIAAICVLTLRRTAPRWLWVACVALTAAFGAGIAAHIVRGTYGAVLRPPAYDFMCFWIFGSAALRFHDPYTGGALHAAASLLGVQHYLPAHIAQAFSRGVLDPGMPYPPTSVVLFYPLGYFTNIHYAALAWWLVNLTALSALILVMWRSYFKTRVGLLATCVLVAGFLPTDWTLMTGQTPILMTLFAVLFAVDANETRSGLWLALAVIAKPIALFLLLYPLVKRQYRTLIAATSALGTAALAAIALTSTRSFLSYFTNTPSERVPGYMFRHPGHQSLFAEILRWSGDTSAHYRVFDNHLYLSIAIALIALSTWICAKLERQDRPIALALLASLALVIYPVTQHFYGMMLLLTLGVLWRQYGSLQSKNAIVAAYWAAEATLMGVAVAAASMYMLPPAAAQCAFVAFVLSWTTFAAIALHHVLRRETIAAAAIKSAA